MSKYKDSLKDFRASIALIEDPMAEYREMLSSISDPVKDFRASMALIEDPMTEYREMLSSISDPMKDFRASMSLIADPMREYREMLSSISDPMKDFRAPMPLIADPMAEHREILTLISDPMKDFGASLTRISIPSIEIRKTIASNESLKLIRETAFEVQPEINIDNQGTITLDTRHISISELQEISDKIFKDSLLAQTDSLEEALNNLVNEIKKQRDPLFQRLITFYIYPFIIILIASLINPIADYHIKSYLNASKRTIAKELKTNVNSTIKDKNLLRSIRYVSADVLNVRASASVKSKSIGQLYFSSTVLVIEKRKNWTLIEWHDSETNVEITGWVFSRYLAKFN